MGTAMQTVIGSAVLIKNGIGAAGLIVLAFLFLIPAVKLAVIVLMYQAAQGACPACGGQADAHLPSQCI